MVRNLLILMLFLSVGLGASVAQSDIFVRQSPKATDEEDGDAPQKTNIFLRPFVDIRKQKGSEAAVNRYKPRLNTANVQRQIEEELKTLAYWQKRDVGPRNVEEHRSYAFAMRAENRAAMLIEDAKIQAWARQAKEEQRQAVQQYIEKTTPDMEALRAADAAIQAEKQATGRGGVTRVRTDYGAQKSSTNSVKRIYRKPTNTLEKPQRVFRDYR